MSGLRTAASGICHQTCCCCCRHYCHCHCRCRCCGYCCCCCLAAAAAAAAVWSQAVQRFESLADLDTHHTTVEEREEYEQHIRNGVVVYAGVVSIHCAFTARTCLFDAFMLAVTVDVPAMTVGALRRHQSSTRQCTAQLRVTEHAIGQPSKMRKPQWARAAACMQWRCGVCKRGACGPGPTAVWHAKLCARLLLLLLGYAVIQSSAALRGGGMLFECMPRVMLQCTDSV
jgi:hypothetical protein